MNIEAAKKALRESLARPSSTPNTSSLPREDFLAQELQAFEACIIEPIAVKATPSRWAVEQLGLELKEQEFLAVAHSGTTWLLFNLENREFYQASSKANEPEPLTLTGFSSDDALTEWRG